MVARWVEALERAHPGLPCSNAPVDRICYARDLWPRHHLAVRAGRIAEHAPAAVAWPRDTAEVQRLVAWCAAEGVELVPFGAGSGVCSGVLPSEQTLVVDLKRMARWRRLDPEAGTVEVEAGVQGIRFEEELQARGLTVGHFPSSILCSTVGGWVAARGAGQCSGLYGKIEDMVVSLECVDGRGERARLHRRAHGPSLVPLWVGSEGVLGIVTSVALRLHPFPEHRSLAGYAFGHLDEGWEAIRALVQRGLRPAVCRLYDPFDSLLARLGAVRPRRHAAAGGNAVGRGAALQAKLMGSALLRPRVANGAIAALGSRLLGGSLLVLVFEGPRDDCEAQLAEADRLTHQAGARRLGPGPARHWLAHRYGISYRQAPVFIAGGFADTMEVAAPWSRLGELYGAVREALGRHAVVMAHLSHAYPDGCSIYFTFAGAGRDDADCERRYDRAWSDALDATVRAGGTLSHHHGVGRSKATKLGAELGVGVELVAAVRQAHDPAGILNPGNMRPAQGGRRPPRRPCPQTPSVDERSLLVHAPGQMRLDALERHLAGRGLSLGASAGGEADVSSWLAAGAPGGPDPWLDPVDHLLAGFSVELPSGAGIDLAPGPRRAVGPDLSGLFFGTGERAGRFSSAHLRVRGVRTARPLLTPVVRNPPIEGDEARWLERTLAAAARV